MANSESATLQMQGSWADVGIKQYKSIRWFAKTSRVVKLKDKTEHLVQHLNAFVLCLQRERERSTLGHTKVYHHQLDDWKP